MRALLLCTFLFSSFALGSGYIKTEKRFQPNKRWSSYSNSEENNIKNLFRKLIKSKTGRALVKAAQRKGKKENKKLLDIVKAGRGSLTDTTLIRKFSIEDPNNIQYETKSLVYINNELTQYDAVLDLAHELTHYVYRKNFNPYEINFTLPEFIKNTIEGRGGEVQAFIMECRVLDELFPNSKDNRYNCKQIKDDSRRRYSFKKTKKRFYQIGSYYDSFQSMLHKQKIQKLFPHVSEDKVSFVSSAYGIPYPVAAFEEYQSVIAKVCANDKRRISYLKAKKGRSPASTSRLEKLYNKRCDKH